MLDSRNNTFSQNSFSQIFYEYTAGKKTKEFTLDQSSADQYVYFSPFNPPTPN